MLMSGSISGAIALLFSLVLGGGPAQEADNELGPRQEDGGRTTDRGGWAAMRADEPPTQTAVRSLFEGCGYLVQGAECVLFQADSGGLYVLDNYGVFDVGDYVQVHGVYDPTCITFCMQGDGCIQDNTIEDCPLPHIAAYGWLVQGVQCVLFQAKRGGLYILENYGSFHVGDCVRVGGSYDPMCITSCMQGDGCIQDNTITAGHATDCLSWPTPKRLGSRPKQR